MLMLSAFPSLGNGLYFAGITVYPFLKELLHRHGQPVTDLVKGFHVGNMAAF